MNESCNNWTSHVPQISNIFRSQTVTIWTSHVTLKKIEYTVHLLHRSTSNNDDDTHASCHIWMSYFTYEQVMSHTNESCHIRMSHVTYKWVVSHMNESCHIWTSHVTHEWVTSHMNKSCHVCTPWVYLLHGRRCNNNTPHESCDILSHVTYERVISQYERITSRWTKHTKNRVYLLHGRRCNNDAAHVFFGSRPRQRELRRL